MTIPLLWPLLCLLVGLLLADGAPPTHFPAFELSLLVLLLALSVWRGWRLALWVACLGLFWMVGWLARGPLALADDPLCVGLDAAESLVLEGRVLELERYSQGRGEVLVEAHVVVERERRVPVQAQLALSGEDPLPVPGQYIRAQVKLKRVEASGNPGVPDPRPLAQREGQQRRGYLLREGWLPLYPLTPPPDASWLAQRLQGSGGRAPSWLTQAWQGREQLRAQLRRYYGAEQDQASALLLGLALGERTELEGGTKAAFSAAGLSHLLAISGSHFSLVAAGLRSVLLLAFLLLPLGLHGRAPELASRLATLPTLGYALLIGLSPSIGRALLMTLCVLVVQGWGRMVDGLALLVLAGLAIAVVEPTALWDIGTQLSFAAVFALLTFAPRGMAQLEAWWLEPLARQERFSPRLLGVLRQGLSLGMTTVAATVGTAPLCVWHFGSLPLVGVVANLVAVPLLGTLALGPLLVGSVLFLLEMPGAELCRVLARACAEAGLMVAGYFGDTTRFPVWEVNATAPMLLLWSVLLLGLLLRGWLRGLVLLACGVGLLFVGVSGEKPGPQAGQLTLTMLNVGQGDGMVLELPDGRVMVLDAGGNGPGARTDPGKQVVLPFLRARGHRRIDILVVSHPHPDHLGGMQALAEALPVGELWVGERPGQAGMFEKLVSTLEPKGTQVHVLSAETPVAPLGGVEVQVLHPFQGWQEGLTRKKDRSVNNGSLVLLLSFGELDLLLTGDIEQAAEKLLLQDARLRRVEVVKVPHHGSDTSSGEALVQATRPALALMGVGRENRFGFPRREVVRRWALAGAEVLRTDLHGAVELRMDGKHITAQTHHPDRRRLLTVPSFEALERLSRRDKVGAP